MALARGTVGIGLNFPSSHSLWLLPPSLDCWLAGWLARLPTLSSALPLRGSHHLSDSRLPVCLPSYPHRGCFHVPSLHCFLSYAVDVCAAAARTSSAAASSWLHLHASSFHPPHWEESGHLCAAQKLSCKAAVTPRSCSPAAHACHTMATILGVGRARDSMLPLTVALEAGSHLAPSSLQPLCWIPISF